MSLSQQNNMGKSPKIPHVIQSSEQVHTKSISDDNNDDAFIRSLTFDDVDNILVIIGDETAIAIDRPFSESSERNDNNDTITNLSKIRDEIVVARSSKRVLIDDSSINLSRSVKRKRIDNVDKDVSTTKKKINPLTKCYQRFLLLQKCSVPIQPVKWWSFLKNVERCRRIVNICYIMFVKFTLMNIFIIIGAKTNMIRNKLVLIVSITIF